VAGTIWAAHPSRLACSETAAGWRRRMTEHYLFSANTASTRTSVVEVAHWAVQLLAAVVCGIGTPMNGMPTGAAPPILSSEKMIEPAVASRMSMRVLVEAEVLEMISAMRSLNTPEAPAVTMVVSGV